MEENDNNFAAEFVTFNIHKTEWDFLSDKEKEFLEAFRRIEIYPDGLKNGEKIDKVQEFKDRIREYIDHIKQNPDETNVEGMIMDCMLELLSKMNMQEFRKLNWDKLI